MTGRPFQAGRLAPALLAGVVALGMAPASGQGQDAAAPARVVVCEGGGVDHCVEIDPRQLPAEPGRPADPLPPNPFWQQRGASSSQQWQPPQTSRPAATGVPYWQPAPSDMAPPSGAYFSSAPAMPTQVWLDWTRVPDPADPGLMVPGRCAWTAEAARGRWLVAARMGDLNALSAAYQWRGKTHAGADSILDRLATVPTAGYWEQAVASAWTGATDVRSQVSNRWRWTDGASVMNLAMREVEGCWFVEFTKDPGQIVEIAPATNAASALPASPAGTAAGSEASAPRAPRATSQGWIEVPEQAEPGQARPGVQRDPQNPDVLVF